MRATFTTLPVLAQYKVRILRGGYKGKLGIVVGIFPGGALRVQYKAYGDTFFLKLLPQHVACVGLLPKTHL